MTDFRRRTLHVLVPVVFLVSLLAPSALLAESGTPDLETLRTKLRLVFLFEDNLPELAAKGQGLSQLDQEIRGALEATPETEATGILKLLYELQLKWADLEYSRDNVEQAILHYEVIVDAGQSTPGFKAAAGKMAGIYESQGAALQQADDDTQALVKYALAEDLFSAAGDKERALEIGRKSAGIEQKEGMRAFDAKKYDLAFDRLSTLEARKRPAFVGSKGEKALTWMKASTGILSIRTLTVPVKVPGQSVTGLKITLKRTGPGSEVTRPFAARFRWEIGEYRLGLLGPDGKVVLSVPVRLTPAGGAAEIPSKLPDNMAFIPAGGGVTKPFFIDKTEVTVGAFTKEFPSHTCRSARSNFPAHGVTFAQAKRYARSVGKTLPTEKQWLRAAFGGKNLKFPWGNTDSGSINRHCNVGTGGPQRVGYFLSGQNDFDLDDMAGNVWEWLADEYAIGGGFGKEQASVEPDPGGLE